MNARQKAKKYKRMYEALSKKPVEFKVVRHNIDTLRLEKFYPEAFVLQKEGNLRDVMVNDFAYSLSDSLGKYINYTTEWCERMNMYRVYGEIKVVRSEEF